MPYQLTDEVRDSLVIRMQYDASASWNNMFSYSGTAIESVFSNPLWWALTGLHWMLWFLKEFHTCQEGTAPLTCIPAKQVFDRCSPAPTLSRPLPRPHRVRKAADIGLRFCADTRSLCRTLG